MTPELEQKLFSRCVVKRLRNSTGARFGGSGPVSLNAEFSIGCKSVRGVQKVRSWCHVPKLQLQRSGSRPAWDTSEEWCTPCRQLQNSTRRKPRTSALSKRPRRMRTLDGNGDGSCHNSRPIFIAPRIGANTVGPGLHALTRLDLAYMHYLWEKEYTRDFPQPSKDFIVMMFQLLSK